MCQIKCKNIKNIHHSLICACLFFTSYRFTPEDLDDSDVDGDYKDKDESSSEDDDTGEEDIEEDFEVKKKGKGGKNQQPKKVGRPLGWRKTSEKLTPKKQTVSCCLFCCIYCKKFASQRFSES